MAFDYEQLGFISVNDLKKALERAGEKVTDDETYWDGKNLERPFKSSKVHRKLKEESKVMTI